MNLLNKKIKDKIKFLDDIDKQYNPHVQSQPKKNYIPMQNKNPNENINSVELIKNSKNENFDQVYSNFMLNGDPNLNLNNSKATKENSKNNTNVEDRLNKYGRYIKTKIEVQRQMENAKIKNTYKPKINKTRNKTEKNDQILNYQNYKKNIVKNKSKQKSNIDQYLNSLNSNFTYHPKIDKKSIQLAKKMEPSSIRLNKKKKLQLESDLQPKMFYVNLYKHKENNKKNDSKNKSIYEKMNNLYIRGIEQKKKKDKIISENKKKKEEEYKQYSYKPNVNKILPYNSTKNKIKKNLSLVINRSKSKKNNSKREVKKYNIYEKNYEWKKKIEKENIKKKKLKEETIQKLCTFRPLLGEKTIEKPNKKYLDKVFEQINSYVAKRRQNIKYKKSEENYRKKKFFIAGEGYTPRCTIPQEFEFQTELRERSLGKNKNRTCENFHINNNRSKNSGKKSLGDNENHSWFFKEEMSTNGCNYNSNISNINESHGTKDAFTHTQFDFIEAVNLLHDKLDKLNI